MRSRTAFVETALIVIGLVLLAFGQEQQLGGDGLARWEAVRLLFEQGRVSETIYSLIGPFFSFPWWLGGDHVMRYYNVSLFALSIAALYFLLRDHMPYVRRFLLLVVAGSMIAPHVRNFYGEVFTMVAVGVGIVAVVTGFNRPGAAGSSRGAARWPRIAGRIGPRGAAGSSRGAARWPRIIGWVAVVLGAANTPASLVGLGLVAAGESVRFKRLRYLVPFVAGAAIVALELALRRGFGREYSNNVTIAKTIMPYSGMDGFTYPFLFGLLAILFSFGKGLVFYLPGMLLPVWRSLTSPLRRIYLLWTLFLAGLVLAYAGWWSWYGGDYWGPRFFVIGILPASLALAAALTHPRGPLFNVATLAVLALSVWIGADSLVLGGYFPAECFIGYYQYAYVCHFTPEFSQLWYPFVRPPALTGGQALEFLYYGVVFAWLAVPLLVRIIAQLADRLDRIVWRAWRW